MATEWRHMATYGDRVATYGDIWRHMATEWRHMSPHDDSRDHYYMRDILCDARTPHCGFLRRCILSKDESIHMLEDSKLYSDDI